MGTTTNYDLPYPEPTDPVANTDAAIQSLAEAVDTELDDLQTAIDGLDDLLDDTGWQALTLNTGYTNNTTPLAYRVLNGVCYLRGDVKPSAGSFAAPADHVIVAAGGLPSSARPSASIILGAFGNNATGPACRLSVPTDGSLHLLTANVAQNNAHVTNSWPVT